MIDKDFFWTWYQISSPFSSIFSRQPIYSPGLDITNYGKTLYKQIHAPKHLEILGRKARAKAWCHFHTNPVVILLRAITVSGFNQLSSHLSTFWSKNCRMTYCKRVSQYHLKWSFASLTKTWQKDQSFSGPLWALSAHIGITSSLSTWNLRFLNSDQPLWVNLAGSATSHSPAEPFSATKYVTPTVGLSSDLPVQIPRHQHGICGISGISMFRVTEGCELWCTWFVLHCECFIYILIYDIIFMTTTRRSVLLTKTKQVVTLSELI